MSLKILYFASIRESIGIAEEEVQPSLDVNTVKELINWLSASSNRHTRAFEKHAQIHVAIDQVHSKFGSSINGAKEIAFFFFFTGG